jgi:uncharacterized cupin superfamily protein
MVKFEKRKPTEEEIKTMKSWPTWESPMPPGFDWEYGSEIETFFVLEGEAEIDSDGDTISFGPGDMVTIYPETGKCKWAVKKQIKKHYKFD